VTEGRGREDNNLRGKVVWEVPWQGLAYSHPRKGKRKRQSRELGLFQGGPLRRGGFCLTEGRFTRPQDQQGRGASFHFKGVVTQDNRRGRGICFRFFRFAKGGSVLWGAGRPAPGFRSKPAKDFYQRFSWGSNLPSFCWGENRSLFFFFPKPGANKICGDGGLVRSAPPGLLSKARRRGSGVFKTLSIFPPLLLGENGGGAPRGKIWPTSPVGGEAPPDPGNSTIQWGNS